MVGEIMGEREELISRVEFVESTIGKKKPDFDGVPVSGCRMDPSRAYAPIPDLLSRVINYQDQEAWSEIIQAIDYIYLNLNKALGALERETGFAKRGGIQIAGIG